MKLLFTLDYELFMGNHTGTVDCCLIVPLEKYLEAVKQYGLHFTIFVDAAYLYALRQHMDKYICLRNDYHKIERHLQRLQHEGHDIQLHIHPQWYYSEFDGTKWQLDNEHYKLADMPHTDRINLVKESKYILDNIIGKTTTIFRAGGFSAQPTNMLTEIFDKCGLRTDSSVCPGEYYNSQYQQYDYRCICKNQIYHFDNDICEPQSNGRYTELPISMHKVSPVFHWQLTRVRLLTKLTKSSIHTPYGDGHSIRSTRTSIFHRLLHSSPIMTTIDGYKISFLKDAINEYARKGSEMMCILGHTKLATPYSINKLHKICDYAKGQGHQFCTISEVI